jgi:hypothetical protein
MKVCYVDESGNQAEEPCLVMVGIVVDAARLNRSREEFAEIFDVVQSLFLENLREIKGSKMIFGRDRWRNIDPDVRKKIAGYFCEWVGDRKHHLALSAIDRTKLTDPLWASVPGLGNDPWLAAALHVALQVQKHHQGKKANKGHTFLVFDENKAKADSLAELIFSPPAWTDAYYGRAKKQAQLDQLIDSAFTVKSHHAGLVQAADVFALIFRRYSELHDHGSAEFWAGEKALIDGYVNKLAGRLLPSPSRWPAHPQCPGARFFNAVAPDSLRQFGQ